MPPSLHYSLEGEDPKRDEKVGKYLRNGLLGYGDDKVRVNSVWEEGVYLVKLVSSEVCMDKGICKSIGHPDHPDQHECEPKRNGQLW